MNFRYISCIAFMVLLNCCEKAYDPDTIAVEENEETLGANCICPYDLSYRIGPLNYGRYVFRMERGDIEFPIIFNSSTSGVFIKESNPFPK